MINVDHSYLYLGDVGPTRQLTLRKLLFNERKLLRDSSQGPDPAPDPKDFVRDVRYLVGGSNMNDFPSCLVSDVSAVLFSCRLGVACKDQEKETRLRRGILMLEISSTRIRENEADQKRAKS